MCIYIQTLDLNFDFETGRTYIHEVLWISHSFNTKSKLFIFMHWASDTFILIQLVYIKLILINTIRQAVWSTIIHVYTTIILPAIVIFIIVFIKITNKWKQTLNLIHWFTYFKYYILKVVYVTRYLTDVFNVNKISTCTRKLCVDSSQP